MSARPTTERLQGLIDGTKRSGRWTPIRKAAALTLLGRGDLTEAQLLEIYGVQAHEVANWKQRRKRYGRKGLAVGRLQELGH